MTKSGSTFIEDGVASPLFSLVILKATTHANIHPRRHRTSMSEQSGRLLEESIQANRFVQPGDGSDSRTIANPGPTVMSGFSGRNTCVHVWLQPISQQHQPHRHEDFDGITYSNFSSCQNYLKIQRRSVTICEI